MKIFLNILLFLSAFTLQARSGTVTAASVDDARIVSLDDGNKALNPSALPRFFRILKKRCNRLLMPEKSGRLNGRKSVRSSEMQAEEEPQVHRKAVSSLIFGAVALFLFLLTAATTVGLFYIAAVVLGVIGFVKGIKALKRIKESGGFYRGKGMAIVGIILGILTGLLPIVISLLFIITALIIFGGF